MLVGGRNIPTFGSQYQKLSPYAKLRVQRLRLAQAAQQAMANTAAFSSSMFGAKISQGQGLAELAIRAATERTQNAVAAKQQQLASSIDLSV